MNMSQAKGTVNLINVKDLKVKMAGGALVNLRGRLHTSRAKGGYKGGGPSSISGAGCTPPGLKVGTMGAIVNLRGRLHTSRAKGGDNGGHSQSQGQAAHLQG